ncbi:hypothetical protein GV794_09945 [Nocardia cyriacigeorgica]|uniref:Uncharacterized protein n=1 Tax=Nocardia cyriacigeorgica TaxID=135487 RepID=A0ABX0CNI2_9NOCA|nr:hypothetical protein [Nocardia cyriacigeorgica]NEW53213.1 hypothetical protein [Nocardia cyriacigeorgica]NEW55971.1 hypothetical protein [Nocardia cyriacigeorgica]
MGRGIAQRGLGGGPYRIDEQRRQERAQLTERIAWRGHRLRGLQCLPVGPFNPSTLVAWVRNSSGSTCTGCASVMENPPGHLELLVKRTDTELSGPVGERAELDDQYWFDSDRDF